MRLLIAIVALLSVSTANAEDKIEFSFIKPTNLDKIVEKYSLATGQIFIVDLGYLGGSASILVHRPITKQEAFNHLSSALAVNGYAIGKQDEVMIIKSARTLQRDLIEVSSELPSLQPQRMYTWVYQFKNIRAADIQRDLKFMSKDGEHSINTSTNQIILTDWVSNIIRVSEVFKILDKPLEPCISELLKRPKKDSTKTQKTETLPN